MAAAVSIRIDDLEELEAEEIESPELQWFDRVTLTPIPPPLERALHPDGTFGDRAWRARGWSTED